MAEIGDSRVVSAHDSVNPSVAGTILNAGRGECLVQAVLSDLLAAHGCDPLYVRPTFAVGGSGRGYDPSTSVLNTECELGHTAPSGIDSVADAKRLLCRYIGWAQPFNIRQRDWQGGMLQHCVIDCGGAGDQHLPTHLVILNPVAPQI